MFQSNNNKITYHPVSGNNFKIIQTMKLMTSNDQNSK